MERKWGNIVKSNASRVGAGILLASLMLFGIGGSIWAGIELRQTAKTEWLNKFRIDAARLTDNVLFWMSKTKVNLRAISSQVRALEISEQVQFMKLVDDAASWDPDVVFDGVAFAQRVMRPERAAFEARWDGGLRSLRGDEGAAPDVFEAFAVTMSSVGDGVLSHLNDLTTHPALRTTVMTAYRLPGHVILGPTYVGADDRRMVLVATAASVPDAKGVMVAELDITDFFNVFSADSLPKGLRVRLIERDSEARAESVFLPIVGDLTPGPEVVATEVLRLVSGQARWDLNWDVTTEYLGGPSDFAALLVQIGGSLLSILLFGTIGYLTFQNLRFHSQVAERTAALSQNSMIVQLTMDSIDQGFAVWNNDQRLVVWSRRCYDFWLEPPKDVLRVGMHVRELLTHLADAGAYGENPDNEIIEQEYDRIVAAGESSEDQFATPGGQHVVVRRFPLERGGYVAVYTDITEQEQATRNLSLANDELVQQRRKADAASQAKTDFLATMSHEIRTPMTGVMGFADMLLEDDLARDSAENVHKIKDATQALLTIINDILDISKLEAGKVEIENLDFHLPSVMRDVVSLFEGSGRSGLDFELNLEDGLPEAIKSDPTRIRQILVNLIGNATKFTQEGVVTVSGELQDSDTDHPYLRISVRDTGIGMTQETISKLFVDFSQADASITRRFEGTGLGLSICRRLVELMGGDIGVESEFGQGSTFWFTVPYVEATSKVLAHGAEKSSRSVEIKTSRPLNILVAEDNEINQVIIGETLGALKHEFHIVDNGAKVVSAHEEEDYDLILMDVRMPEMSGLDATRMIRGMKGEKATIPIVALTADAMAEHKKNYFKAGMDEVATKPIDRRELTTAINNAMGEEIHLSVAIRWGTEAPPVFSQVSNEVDHENNEVVSSFLKEIEQISDAN